MGRHSQNKAHSQRIKRIAPGLYEISWAVDRYYASSRLRHPTGYSRLTDTAGAVRFARKHDLDFVPEGEQHG